MMRASLIVSRVRAEGIALYVRARKNPVQTGLLVLLVVGVLALIMGGEKTPEVPAPTDTTPSVTLKSVGALSSDTEPLVLLGEVRSTSQAELRTEKPGEITRVYVSAGDTVRAGTILAEVNPSAERAGVLSAQGALSGAEAQLAKVVSGARSEDLTTASAQAGSAITSLLAAQESARSAYTQAYALAAEAVYAQADDYFTNVYTVRPSFRISSANYDERREIETTRVTLGSLLEAWKTNTQTSINTADLDETLVEAQSTLEQIATFLNTISGFVSEQKISDTLSASDKATQEAQLAGARTAVSSARSSISGARQSLANAESAKVTARSAQDKLVVGARIEDVQAAEAVVTQARGALAGAQSALERALIRTPISGTVSTLNVSLGDFVSSFESVAVVANPGALQIEAYVSANTLDRIVVGMPVVVGGGYAGTVTSRAPGLDPETKKARITVGLTNDAPLVNGSFVEIALMSDTATSTTTVTSAFSIPITAIKVLPRGLAVFTVTDGALVAVPMTEGPIVGATMLVKEGLTSDILIVTDVRGLKEGDRVTVAQ